MATALLIAALSFAALPADAPVATDAPSLSQYQSSATLMESQLRTYFAAERLESMVFVGIGVLALTSGLFFLAGNNAFLKGMSFPLMGLALVQLAVGGSILWRTNAQVGDLVSLMGTDAAKFVADETTRMVAVNRAFDLYKIAEIVIAVVGAGLVVTGYALGNQTLMGIGAGAALQGVVLLSLDLFAEARADRYTEQIAVFGQALLR